MAATTPIAPSSRASVRCTRPRQRTRTGPARVISLGRVRSISTGEPSLTSLERKKYTPRELTSRDSVLVSPTAAPVVQRTVSGSRMEKRWVVRRSEPVKAYLQNRRIECSRVGGVGTIGLQVQKGPWERKYGGTTTGYWRFGFRTAAESTGLPKEQFEVGDWKSRDGVRRGVLCDRIAV